MSRSFKNVKKSPSRLLKAVAKAIQESKKKSTLCKEVIKTVCRSSEYDEKEIINAIKEMCNSGLVRLGKVKAAGKNLKFGNRKILLLKEPYESDSETDSDSNDSSDDCNDD